jgi:toxin ParE1/3/4
MPGLGSRYESDDARLAGVRVASVRGFRNHLVFYREFDKGIEVLHVLHGARDIDSAFSDELLRGELWAAIFQIKRFAA